MKQPLMESQPSSLQAEHHMIFKQPYELLPFHEDNIWDNTLINEPALLNSPNLWAKSNLDNLLLKEALMTNSLYTSVNDPWQSMSAHEIPQLAICSDHHYMSSYNLHNTGIESGSITTNSSSHISSLNPQSLQEDTPIYIIDADADAPRCGYTCSDTMSNAPKNEPSASCMHMPHSLNMQDTRAPAYNVSLSSEDQIMEIDSSTKPYNHSSLLAAPPLCKVDADHYKSLLMRLHDDGQASLSETTLEILSATASMPSLAPMFRMATRNEQISSNFVKPESCSGNLVQAPCYGNSVSHPSATTLAKVAASSINYHVNTENDQIIKCPNHSSSISLLAASTIQSSLGDRKHHINNSAPSTVSLSHPNTTTPANLCHFVDDQVIKNDQVQKNTDFPSFISLHPVLNHLINPKQQSLSPDQRSISLHEHSSSHNQHSSLSVRLNRAHKSAPCSIDVPEMTFSSMSSSPMSDEDHHHELEEEPLEGAAKANMDDHSAVDQASDQKSMNTNDEETKKLGHAEVHPSHIGDADNCSRAHTTSLDSLKTKKISHKKGKKKKLQKQNLRQPRIALVTQSENERLEDGFRWRKYGQKSVKNSPYPRSYYRCTTKMCSVKKRVERSPLDASMVITTYEGSHNHHTLSILREISQPHITTQTCINNGNSSFNTTKPHLQCSLGTSPSTTKSFDYNYYANRYSLIMQLQAQHSNDPSTHSPLSYLAETYE